VEAARDDRDEPLGVLARDRRLEQRLRFVDPELMRGVEVVDDEHAACRVGFEMEVEIAERRRMGGREARECADARRAEQARRQRPSPTRHLSTRAPDRCDPAA
jgi:hypothetical protein